MLLKFSCRSNSEVQIKIHLVPMTSAKKTLASPNLVFSIACTNNEGFICYLVLVIFYILIFS